MPSDQGRWVMFFLLLCQCCVFVSHASFAAVHLAKVYLCTDASGVPARNLSVCFRVSPSSIMVTSVLLIQ